MNWSLERSLYPVETIHGADENGRMNRYLVNADTGTRISKVSDRYTVVQNRDLVLPLMEKFGEPSVKMLNGNHAHIFEFKTGREFDLGEGDIIREKFIVSNSYNKSRSYNFHFGALRLVCTNGLTSGVSVFSFKKIHVGDIPVGEMIQNAIEKYKENSFSLWRAFKGEKMTQEQQLSLINEWTPFDFTRPKGKLHDKTPTEILNEDIKQTARWIVQKPESLDNQRNGWGLFNQMNQAVTRNLWGNSNANRRMLGDKRSEEFLKNKLEVTV